MEEGFRTARQKQYLILSACLTVTPDSYPTVLCPLGIANTREASEFCLSQLCSTSSNLNIIQLNLVGDWCTLSGPSS